MQPLQRARARDDDSGDARQIARCSRSESLVVARACATANGCKRRQAAVKTAAAMCHKRGSERLRSGRQFLLIVERAPIDSCVSRARFATAHRRVALNDG